MSSSMSVPPTPARFKVVVAQASTARRRVAEEEHLGTRSPCAASRAGWASTSNSAIVAPCLVHEQVLRASCRTGGSSAREKGQPHAPASPAHPSNYSLSRHPQSRKELLFAALHSQRDRSTLVHASRSRRSPALRVAPRWTPPRYDGADDVARLTLPRTMAGDGPPTSTPASTSASFFCSSVRSDRTQSHPAGLAPVLGRPGPCARGATGAPSFLHLRRR